MQKTSFLVRRAFENVPKTFENSSPGSLRQKSDFSLLPDEEVKRVLLGMEKSDPDLRFSKRMAGRASATLSEVSPGACHHAPDIRESERNSQK